jgi:hypothetical protein
METPHRYSHLHFTKKGKVRWVPAAGPVNPDLSANELYTADDIVRLVQILVSNTFIHNGERIMRQVRGLPMGTNPAPHMADLTCYRPEAQAMDRLMATDIALARRFASTCRYIDDILSLDNPGFAAHVSLVNATDPNPAHEPIYPEFLLLKQTNANPQTAEYLGMNIRPGRRSFIMTVSNTGAKLPVPKINFPSLQGNFPQVQGYGVLTGQLHRIARINTRATEFARDTARLHEMILTKGYTRTRMLKTMQAFLSHHNPYRTPGSAIFSMVKTMISRS